MEIIKLCNKNLKEIVKIVEKFIKEGKVIVCPTDTVYGIICDARNEKAIVKIFKIKKRSWQKPISIFVKDIKIVKDFAEIDKDQEKFLKKFWPGKAIIILKAKRKFSRRIVSKFGKIGLRIPKYKLLDELLNKFNNPLAQTSANISGEPAPTKIKEIIKQFRKEKHQPDLILDAGDLKLSRPSRVIDLTPKKPKIIRE